MSNHQSGQWRTGTDRKTNFDKKQFSEAGEQAARVFGHFMALASDLGRTLGDGVDVNVNSATRAAAGTSAETLREAGEALREYRKAAGYTIEGFARELDRQGAVDAVEAAEAGRSAFPKAWLERAASLLSNGDTLAFYEKFYGCYDPGTADDVEQAPADTSRADSLAALFRHDQELEKLSDEQFEKLRHNLWSHYQSVKQLLNSV